MSRSEADVLAAARSGDADAFEQLVARHRSELRAHCYRMLGSPHDAEDAVQETLVAAWRGLAGFEQRSSLRAWLYRIATNCCLRQLKRRPPRMLSWDHGPARSPADDIGEFRSEPWLEPWPDDPADAYEQRESIELAYVAALQHLPASQRAVLILREVLAFSAAEVASMLDTTVASVNSALQRARKTLAERGPRRSQQAERAAMAQDRERELIDAFVAAWERSDVPAIVELLTEDVRFTMPPLPAWYDGRDAVAGFMAQRMFEAPWRLVPITANGQPAFGCYQWDGEAYTLGAVNVVSLRGGRISWLAGFLDPAVHTLFELPRQLGSADR
jgi:RNA polymerase sigma-70 factor (TIGR02960 family)